MRNYSFDCSVFGPVVQMLIKDISFLELWQPICSVELNHLCNFEGKHHEEQFCEIILNLDQWFEPGEDVFIDISYLELWWPLCLAEQNHFCNFARGHHEQKFCEVILNLDQ